MNIFLLATHRCFTHGVCVEPAEVALIVDRKPFQEISLLGKGDVISRLIKFDVLCD